MDPNPLDEASNNCRKATVLCDLLIAGSGQRNANTLDAIIKSQGGNPTNSVYWPESRDMPWMYLARNGDYDIVLLGPCPTSYSATRLWDAYFNVWTDAPFAAANRVLMDAAQVVFTRSFSRGPLVTKPFHFAGYSMGGAVAQLVALQLYAADQTDVPEVVTFGAPKAFSRAQGATFDFTQTTRWMCHNDPVPLVPIPVGGLPSISAVVSALQINRAFLFVQSPGGLQIDASGTVTQANYPSDGDMGTQLSFATWLWDMERDGRSELHSLNEYRHRFDLYNAAHPQRPVPEGGTTDGGDWGEPNAPILAQELRRQEDAQAQAIAQVQQAQNIMEVAIPSEAQFIVSRRGRRIYDVLWSGRTITTTTSKRTAHALARHANRMLNSLQHQAVVDPDAVSQAMIDYLVVAQDPTAGFVPRLNVDLP